MAQQQSYQTYEYKGCYKDIGATRAIPDYRKNVSSVDECGKIAKDSGASVFGLQYYGQCFTGFSEPEAEQHGKSDSQCPSLGGAWTNQVYAAPQQPSYDKYQYQGCYKDSWDRAVPIYQKTVSNVDECGQIAKDSGASVFGVQYYGQCFTGFSLPEAQKYGQIANNKCPSLGGAWTNQLYAVPHVADTKLNVLSKNEYNTIQSLQNHAKDIISTETNRLQDTSHNYASKSQNLKEMVSLTQSYQERQKQYLIMLIVFIFTLVLTTLLLFIKKRFHVESILMDILVSLIVGIGFITIILTYMNILSRDRIHFDQLEYVGKPPPTAEEKAKSLANKQKKGKVVSSIGSCYGAECCEYSSNEADGYILGKTYWDKTTNSCKK